MWVKGRTAFTAVLFVFLLMVTYIPVISIGCRTFDDGARNYQTR